MLLSQARRLLIIGGLSVQDDVNRYEEFDDAIQQAGNDFTEYCGGFEEASGTVHLGGTAHTFDITSVTDFRPERFIRMELGSRKPVVHKDYQTVARAVIANGSTGTTGTVNPTMFAFSPGGTSGIVDFTTGTSGTVATLYYKKPFTTWTPGGTANGTVVLNIPDRYAFPVFRDGAASIYQLPDPDQRWIDVGWQRYLAHREYVKGEISTDRGILELDANSYMGV